MYAWQLKEPKPVEQSPLSLVDLPIPTLREGDLLIKVRNCAACHTDLHIVEGEIERHKMPIVPGHQIVGIVEKTGPGVTKHKVGDRVGVAWLNWADGTCSFCKRDEENLCDNALFTGYDVDGGYAEYQVTNERFVYSIPQGYSDAQAAPLLCGGVIGYRALRLANAKEAQRLGLYGFGSSAHLALQVANHWGVQVYVFTRSPEHRKLAESLGAIWTGSSEDDPNVQMDSSIIFAPAGSLIPPALAKLRKGGTLTLAGIYMSPIPQFDYSLLWGERVIRSVANATRRDAEEMLAVAAEVPIHVEIDTFDLDQVNEVLMKLKRSEIRGSAVLVNPA
jgi:propanol-preferring alcohol dehydrogenase